MQMKETCNTNCQSPKTFGALQCSLLAIQVVIQTILEF